ncbi:SIS domain-containing protein [Aeromicrobium phragmitis]|uniref:SIS domain-containing protein n=1 Tax=Aeromicrobium phragmitis TaxID=2478914 RepID=A0A3L8PQW0_9ACTN|nr:SIS domain-containing protein [Aeromicrobium phragmitis]RLV57023.1 SIS domain-containing protein [Aeromicrobium phragmitis]
MSQIGGAMRREMQEQPEALAAMAGRLPELIAELRAAGVQRRAGLAILARGSSDNASRVAGYSAQVRSGMPVSLLSPSVYTSFGQATERYGDWTVLAVSQSGQTPEIVNLAGRFREAGALVVGMTNDENSELAQTAGVHLALDVGPETAVPATKTVTAQMLAGAAVAAAVSDVELDPAALSALGDHAAAVLDDASGFDPIIEAITAAGNVAMVGRGYAAAAAFESALKLQETTGLMAHGFSTADFRHGPLRLAVGGTPVVGFAGSTRPDTDTTALLHELAGHAPTVLVGPRGGVAFSATEPELEAILATIRGQQLALGASLALGLDPDRPRGLSKVTMTE